MQLKALLDEKFFNSCLVHEEGKKNEENGFCMDCCFSVCFHCMSHHQAHRILQIRRYMYNDVLRLKDAMKIFDCSLIQVSFHSVLFMIQVVMVVLSACQWYKTNSEKVVFLRPRKGISLSIRGSRCSCLVCNQSVKSSFVYCSMVCKFSTVAASDDGQSVYSCGLNNPGRSSVVSGSIVSMESSVEENSPISSAGNETNYESMAFVEEAHNHDQKASITTTSSASTRKLHVRKCVPQRSPFF
ncbi:hypothetical protein R6Q57_012177 [Mikania cordata]